MRVLGLIPARGGSKRLPRKNILTCFGKPLIAWTIEAAKKSQLITETWVSTEDAEIAAIAKARGANVVERPIELAQDDTTSEAVIEHALGCLDSFDWICLLQPTSPTRTVEHIDRCLKIALSESRPVFSTDDMRTSNGAIYIWRTDTTLTEALKNVIWYPLHCIDINTLDDFQGAEGVLNRVHCKKAAAKIPKKEWWMNI